MRPLCSILTPTWNRHDQLINVCLRSVKNQTYENIEHIVISDGEDDELRRKIGDSGVRFFELGRNWRHFSGGHTHGSQGRLVASALAKGAYIAYLDDDDEFLPFHVDDLVGHLEATGSDFVWSQFCRYWSDGRDPDIVGGSGRLEYGHVGTPNLLHRVEVLTKCQWHLDRGYGEDWDFYEQLIGQGYKGSHLPKVTARVHKNV